MSDPIIEDDVMEQVQVELNLTQLADQHRKKPRIHWATSPLAKQQITSSGGPVGANDQSFLEDLRRRDGRGGEGDENKDDILKNALSGLLRSKSTGSSPLVSEKTPGRRGKRRRNYESPLLLARNYITTTAPSSDSTIDTTASPTKANMASPKVMDIEDLSVDSSFFSENEILTQSIGRIVESTKDESMDGAEFDFDVDGLDFDGMLEDQLPPPALHKRLIVQGVEQSTTGLKVTGINSTTGVLETIDVCGMWTKCLILQPPFPIHIIIGANAIIDDHGGYLVVLPDTLISATMVADSFSCSRRAVLSTRTQASVEDNKPSSSLICGSIVHDIVEKALLTQQYDADFLHKLIPEQIKNSLVDIFCAETDEASIMTLVQGLLANFPEWAHHHLVDPPVTQEVFIKRVVRVEENLWSHTFGLKGKIDATVLVNDQVNQRVLLAPFEMKTGHGTTSISHRAQAHLYGFMLWERYKVPIEESLLYYVAKGELFRLQPKRVDLQGLLISRNSLAIQMLTANQRLPPIISNKHVCSRCFQLETCTLSHKVIELGKSETAPHPEAFNQRTSHIGDVSKMTQFYSKWDRLIQLEEQEAVASKQLLWTQNVAQRVQNGNCIADLELISCVPVPEAESRTFGGWKCEFRRKVSYSSFSTNTQLVEGDPIVVSASDQQLFGLAIGYLSSCTESSMTAVLDRPVNDVSAQISSATNLAIPPVTKFRIDKDELTSGFGLLRTNLLKLAAPESQRLMKLVVDLEAPCEDAASQKSIPAPLLEELSRLDSCQRDAVSKTISTQDYRLILGMPGTGKSTTLALAIRIMVAQGKTILLSSHTHTAIDNVLLKLTSSDPDLRIARLGNPSKIPKALHHYCLDAQKFETLPQLESFYMNARIVAVTCLGANHSLLQKRRFDVCIVDEASQISVPACIGPLRLASSFLLVGDHYQLPPLVRSRQAVSEGLNKSLFATLAEAHPQSVSMLRLQYRMNSDIMAISNTFVYGGMLQCGLDTVSNARMALPNFYSCTCNCSHTACWLSDTIAPQKTVLFLDTDALRAYESPSGNSFINTAEAGIVWSVLNSLVRAGADVNELSVISPYRPQLKLLSDAATDETRAIRFSTVDKFQGMDSDCIIISMVRSNPDSSIGQLLRDWNRLNVAFTRARKKLILVGSGKTILGNEAFLQLKDLFSERGWLHQLPVDALMHRFN